MSGFRDCFGLRTKQRVEARRQQIAEVAAVLVDQHGAKARAEACKLAREAKTDANRISYSAAFWREVAKTLPSHRQLPLRDVQIYLPFEGHPLQASTIFH